MTTNPIVLFACFGKPSNGASSLFPGQPLKRARRAYDRVRERCSFHLFRPMTEAYFFGEQDALRRAGAQTAAQLPAGFDLEAFRTADAAFLQLPPDGRAKNDRRIIDMPDRERHPKSYLQYLCDPTLADHRRRYRETHGGAAALRDLDWPQVLSTPPHCPFLHAFLDDLAFALNQPLPFVDKRTPLCLPDLPANRI